MISLQRIVSRLKRQEARMSGSVAQHFRCDQVQDHRANEVARTIVKKGSFPSV